jgi:predicted transcriptional regulator
MSDTSKLTRRERQIMDVLFARSEATVNQIVAALPDPPTSMAVRRMMHILEEKGHLLRRDQGREVVYAPKQSKENAGRSAFEKVLDTFFGGSLEDRTGQKGGPLR